MSHEDLTFGRQRMPRHRGPRVTPVETPEDIRVDWASFVRGMDVSDSDEDISEGASALVQDLFVNHADALERLPGIAQEEVFNPRDSDVMFVQPGLDRTTELVFFDPPFIGVKFNAVTAWHSVGLPPGKEWVASLYGDVLLATNFRDSVIARHPRASTVEVLTAPVGHTIAVFRDRIYIGYVELDGTFQPMGIAWNASTNLYNDWTGIGVGGEVLIQDMFAGDRIVALRPIGFEFLAIVCRHSLWIGVPTGEFDRPLNFIPRVTGVGTNWEPTVCVGHGGVIFLDDTGVRIFDGNADRLLSGPINSRLLPLNPNAAYAGFYDPIQKWYYLMTPTETWIYDLDDDRWFLWTAVLERLGLWGAQSASTAWASGNMTWGSQIAGQRWADFAIPEGAPKLFALQTGKLGIQLPGQFDIFGVASQPRWRSKRVIDGPDDLFWYKSVRLLHKGGGGLRVTLPTDTGIYGQSRDVVLPASADWSPARIPLLFTGRSMSMQLEPTSDSPQIKRVRLIASPYSERASAI